jgi:hypothetical protein
VLILTHSSDNTAMTLPLGLTGVIIPVLAVEPLLDRPGVPPRIVEAHVTVLFPWVPIDRLTDEDERALAAIFAEFRELTRRVAARWPDHPPYGGEFGDDIQPHLTVTMDVSEKVEKFVKDELFAELPVFDRLTEAWLVYSDGERWLRRATFPLGATPPRPRS